MNYSGSLVSQHPWFTAFMLATLATPAGVVLGWLAPRPLDAVVAPPLILVDMWATSRVGQFTAESPSNPILRVLLLVLGIVLTWLFYVLAARLVIWRVVRHAGDAVDSA
jgi:hypothetical protein